MHFLHFDHSEDLQGTATFDAMASVRSGQVAAVRTEIAFVLDWAHAAFPGMQAPLDEGGEWDFDLQERQDATADQCGEGGSPLPVPPWHMLTLSISGGAPFCAAFIQRFGLD